MKLRNEAMKEPRNLLILLGFICQGYSFDYYFMAVVYALIWYVALSLSREERLLPTWVEEVVALVAIVGAYFLGDALGGRYGYNRLVFIGNGLVLFQAARLLRPLNLREKMYSIAIAMIHLGVGTQVVVDYEFILILVGVLYLLPRSLFALEAEKYRRIAGGRLAGLNGREFLYLAVIMVVFFLFFPRFPVAQGSTSRWQIGGRQPEEIDASLGGAQASDILLFRIEGEAVDYVKGSALDVWDGQTWSRSNWASLSDRVPWTGELTGTVHRSVKLLSYRLLGNTIPSDGYVVRVEGPFVQRPYVADHGGVMLPFDLHRDITYDYWTRLDSGYGELTERERLRYTDLGAEPSPQLSQWLNQRLGQLREPKEIAQTLVTWFQDNHEYELGAPNLDRLAPIDDFCINSRPGHCERFASSLAVLLRMRDIPARVGMGWVATERNDLGSFYNIRARHGHAWTEAWIEGEGWVIFDATPYGTSFNLEERSLGLTVFEWIEFVWYSKIVEFGTSEQSTVVNTMGTIVQETAGLVVRYMALIVMGGVIVFMALYARRRGWLTRRSRRAATTHEQSVREARHFYGRMLRILAKRRLYRARGQTPWEFLRLVETERPRSADEVRQLTQWFCDIRYGQRVLTEPLRQAIQEKLNRIDGAG